jgi:TonB family protein
MDETLVFRKTGAGSAQLTSTHGELSTPARRILILLDGRRNLAELADLFGREAVEREVNDLEARGFVRQIDPEHPQDSPTTIIAGHVAPDASAQAAVQRKAPVAWYALVAIVAAFCASAYWVGGAGDREPAAAGAAPPQAATGPAFAGPSAAGAAEVPGPAAMTAAEPEAATQAGAADRTPPAPVSAAATRATPVTTSPAPATALQSKARGPLTAPPPRNAIEAPAARPTLVNAGVGVEAPTRLATSAVAAAPSGTPASASDARATRDVPPVGAATLASQGRAETVSAPAALPATPAPSAGVDGARATGLALAGAAAPAPAVTTVVAPAPAAAPAPITTAALAPVPEPAPLVELHARKHDAPQFPSRALRAGVTQGHVEARLWVTAEGTVDKVDILHANPAHVFDDEVRRALSQWTFDPPGRALQKRVDLNFNQ